MIRSLLARTCRGPEEQVLFARTSKPRYGWGRRMSSLPTIDVPCALCGSERAEPVWTTPDRAFAVPGLYTVARCRDCGFLYQRPRVRNEHLAQCYPDHYPRHQEPSPRVPFKGSAARIRAVRCALARGLGYAHFRDDNIGLFTPLRARTLLRRLRWGCPRGSVPDAISMSAAAPAPGSAWRAR